MAKFDKIDQQHPASPSPIQTTTIEPTTTTREGGVGWERTAKGELFMLAVSNMVSERTFYEDGKDRDERFVRLVHAVAKDDPAWLARMVPWLRNTANMRSASLVAAIEYGVGLEGTCAAQACGKTVEWRDADGLLWCEAHRHSLVGRIPSRRESVANSMARADEPMEAIAYWQAVHGGQLPKWLKRGIGDAAKRLWSERTVLKWDSPERKVRMADILNLCHTDWNGENKPLYDYILHRRLGHKPFEQMSGLPMVAARAFLDNIPQGERRAYLERSLTDEVPDSFLRRAGITWEALSGWLGGPMDRVAWEAVIPSMGYMALLRNLRNFDEAGVSDEVKQRVVAKLTDSNEVAESRQFPIRFYSAYKNVHSDFWKYPLGKALDLTLQNVPSLDGRTLVLVDMSPSMFPGWHEADRAGLYRNETAALLGSALALRAGDATLVGYDFTSWIVPFHKSDSLLPMIGRIQDGRDPGGGTNTFGALTRHYDGHDRVVILTDEQAHDSGRYGLPNVSIYTFNLAGYREAHLPSSDNRITIGGGLTDSAFSMIDSIEKIRHGTWPF